MRVYYNTRLRKNELKKLAQLSLRCKEDDRKVIIPAREAL